MARLLGAAAAICALAAVHQTAAQPVTTPLPESSGGSVVIRCQDCGVINSIREVQQLRSGSPSNPTSDSPVGLVVYIPFGRGANETGSYAGSAGSREWQQRTTTTRYEYTVRMDDGTFRLAQKDGISGLQAGDRVRLDRGQIERWGQ